jgi:plasmid stabilization system protein ParE
MSRRVLWHRRAIADLLNVADWQTAARIDAEVLYFAESGRGTVRRVRSEDGPDELRLYAAPPYYVRFRYDRATRTILVERVLRSRP